MAQPGVVNFRMNTQDPHQNQAEVVHISTYSETMPTTMLKQEERFNATVKNTATEPETNKSNSDELMRFGRENTMG